MDEILKANVGGPISNPGNGFDIGFDEMNLAEFPLGSISERSIDGTKTIVLEDTAWDRAKKSFVPRVLTISGSDKYGLPTATDDDVLLACIQLTSLGRFSSREVFFSRYELAKLLRWKDDTRNYRRLSKSLRGWMGVNVFSDRAFYDKARGSWVNRDFGIFNSLHIYERDIEQRSEAPASSRFEWNEVLFESFQAGYVKQLDWPFYCELNSPVAKRLYRFLDKRFYHDNRVEMELYTLAFQKVRLGGHYTDVSQVKRELQKGITELEEKWELKTLGAKARFIKESKGKWKVVFERRRRRPVRRTSEPEQAREQVQPCELEIELTKREIGPASAHELVETSAADVIQTAIELYDWYNARGQSRSAGFLVHAIRHSESIRMPKGFESSVQVAQRRRAAAVSEERRKDTSRRQDAMRAKAEKEQDRPFVEFWESISAKKREAFEAEALSNTDKTKYDGYFRFMGKDNTMFEVYRRSIIREHFDATHGEQSPITDSKTVSAVE